MVGNNEPPGGYKTVDELAAAMDRGETYLMMGAQAYRELMQRVFDLERAMTRLTETPRPW